jgi:hypothetical protein
VTSRLGNYADLTAGTSAVLGRIVAAVDAELLDVFEALLEAEIGSCLPVQVAWGGIDYGARLHAVVTNNVLLIGAAAEANVILCSVSTIYGARREQVQLRHLAAVQGELRYFALADVDAHFGAAQIDGRDCAALDVDHRSRSTDREIQIPADFLAYLQRKTFDLRLREPGCEAVSV